MTEQGAPIIEVNYDELTYELLKKEYDEQYVQVERNTPNGPVQRILIDVFGLAVVYAFTFVVCDLIRTFKTGQWTRLLWMVLGPYLKFTKAPIIHKIAHFLGLDGDFSPQVTRCRDNYESDVVSCGLHPVPPSQFRACMVEAQSNEADCIEATPEYQQCVDDYNAAIQGATGSPIVTGSSQTAEDHCLDELTVSSS